MSSAAPETQGLRVPSARHMVALGSALGALLERGDLVLLYGPFGAGKTTLVRGIAAGLGVDTSVTSPSFVLETQYTSGRLPLYHVDLYRLDRLDAALLEELEEHVYGDGVTVVEWPELVPAEWHALACCISIEDAADGSRVVRLQNAPAGFVTPPKADEMLG